MIEFILKSRVKYVAIGIIGLFFIILFLSSSGSHSDEEQQLGLILTRKSLNQEKAEEFRKARDISKGHHQQQHSSNVGGLVDDFQVKFISGKELGNQLDNEKKSFQVHTVKITNLERTKVVLECQDPFSSFGKALAPAASFEFRVTDLFAKRHYWCSAKYGNSEFIFRAYGEGAPRDNNEIALHKDGAFINGKNQIIQGPPLNFRQSNKDKAKEDQDGNNENDPNNEVPVVDVAS